MLYVLIVVYYYFLLWCGIPFMDILYLSIHLSVDIWAVLFYNNHSCCECSCTSVCMGTCVHTGKWLRVEWLDLWLGICLYIFKKVPDCFSQVVVPFSPTV